MNKPIFLIFLKWPLKHLAQSAVFVFLTLSFLFTGCARPNYQEPTFNIFVPSNPEKPTDPQANPQDPPVNVGPNPAPDPIPPATCRLFLQAQQLCVNLRWDQAPVQTEFNSFEFYFHRLETPDVPVDLELTVAVVLWMPGMNHGSSPVTIEKTANGKFKVTKVYFIMPGAWEIRFQLKRNQDVADQVYAEITL